MRPIELAHFPPFNLGAAEVRPATREVILPGRREVLEPRIMQVLVALAEANGEILSRGDLNDLAWEGVVVSDDAMNRVMSRLRALGQDTGAFQIETIRKVGYRLTPTDPEAAPSRQPKAPAPRERPAFSPGRRALLAGGGVTVAALAGVAAWRYWDSTRADPQLGPLLDHAWNSIRSGREEDVAAGISSLQLVLQKDPDNARAWGMLALVYAWVGQDAPPEVAAASDERTRDAIARALERDADSELAMAARAWLVPVFGNWFAAEQACRQPLARWPRSVLLLNRLTDVLLQGGRWRDALPVSATLQEGDLISPTCWRLRAQTLHDNGRIEEAEQAIRQGLRLFPRHPEVWFTNLNFLADTGRVREALAFLGDTERRPIGIPQDTWAMNERVIEALGSRSPETLASTLAVLPGAVERGAFPAGRAVIFAAAADRLDEAYRLTESYLFGGGTGRARSRRTHFLFHRQTAGMRGDPRFMPLAQRIGLELYWKQAGVPHPVWLPETTAS